MDLKTFVKETLTQIAEGVNEAKPVIANAGCQLIDRVPSSAGGNIPNAPGLDAALHPVSKIDFDVALDVSAESSRKGGGIIAIASLLGGAGFEGKDKNSSINRVRFSVYMAVQ